MRQVADLEEAAALETLAKAKQWPHNKPVDLAIIHLYEGLAHAGLSQDAEAFESFKKARSLDPELTLPSGTSPRLAEWWARAKPVIVLTPPVESAPKPFMKTSRWVASGLMVAGLAVAAVGVVNGIQASDLNGQAQRAEGVVDSRALELKGQQSATRANVLYAVGGGLGVAGGVVFFF